MGKRLQSIRGKLGIPSGRALIHLAVVEIIINITWERVSKMFTVDYIREIGFLVVVVAGVFAVAWYLPKLTNMKLRTATEPMRTFNPSRLEHDGVLWEDGGYNAWGNLSVIGPLCPKDYTPLAIKDRDGINTSISFDTTISTSEYHCTLVCLECNTEYTLGKKPKEIGDSRAEVGNRFEGKRRRGQ